MLLYIILNFIIILLLTIFVKLLNISISILKFIIDSLKKLKLFNFNYFHFLKYFLKTTKLLQENKPHSNASRINTR